MSSSAAIQAKAEVGKPQYFNATAEDWDDIDTQEARTFINTKRKVAQQSAPAALQKGGSAPQEELITNYQLLKERHGQKALDDAAEQAFHDVYMALLTQGFGDDLNHIRETETIDESNLGMLISALEVGKDIFTPEQKQMVLGHESVAKGDSRPSSSAESEDDSSSDSHHHHTESEEMVRDSSP